MAGKVQRLAKGRKRGEIHGSESGNGQHGPGDAKKEHQQQGQPEAGHGEADKDEDRGRAVEKAPLAHGRGHANGHGDQKGEDERHDVHGKGQGQAFPDLVPDGAVIAGKGLAEIEAHELAEPIGVLDGERAVEAVEFLQAGARFGGGQGIERGLHIRGRARSQMDDSEADDGDAEKDAGDPEGFSQEAFGQGEHVWRTPCGYGKRHRTAGLYGKQSWKERAREKSAGRKNALDFFHRGGKYVSRCGAVAQLGERLNGIQEVVGSIPSSSTRMNARG